MKRNVMLLSTILVASFSFVSSSAAWSGEPVARAKQQSGKTYKAKKSKKITASKSKSITASTSKSTPSASLPAVLSIAAVPAVAVAAEAAIHPAASAHTPAEPAAAPTQHAQTPTPQPAPTSPYLTSAYSPTASKTVQAVPSSQPTGNPYLTGYQPGPSVNPIKNIGEMIDGVQGFLPGLPSLPLQGQSILPSIKTVYPTGEKPLVVLTFKCPTELIGVTPLPTKALHELVNIGFDVINKTDLLAFNMQQVCQ